MAMLFEELGWCPTEMGTMSLRRRREPSLGVDVYEIKLGDEFLMSSLFTASEVALARLGLAELPGTGLDVAVGGLGLGYTAQAALEHAAVRSLLTVELHAAVIEWHRQELLPVSAQLNSDSRCRLVQGDFFAMARADGFDPENAGRRFHAILVDIDHSPRHVLQPGHASFYGADGLGRVADRLYPGGVFALWSNDPPDADFTAVLAKVFANTAAHVVTFHNPLRNLEATNTVYVASKDHSPA